MHRPFAYKCKQTTHGKIKCKLYAATIKLNNSVGIFINISFKDRLFINMTLQNSVGDLIPNNILTKRLFTTWQWICFEFCVRFTAYFDQNISVTILE